MTDKEWQPPKNVPVHIVCAANKDPLSGLIICGARHWDGIMAAQSRALKDTPKYSQGYMWEQGFIDQWGRFYNRKEAMKIVLETGQKFNAERNGGNGEDLYSEGLY